MRSCRFCGEVKVAHMSGPATCADCKLVGNRERSRRGMSDFRLRRSQNAPSPDALAAECWCQASIVLVARPDVRAGRTGTCGRRACHPIEEAA